MAGFLFPMMITSWFLYRYGGFLEKIHGFEKDGVKLSKGVRFIFALPIFVVLAFF